MFNHGSDSEAPGPFRLSESVAQPGRRRARGGRARRNGNPNSRLKLKGRLPPRPGRARAGRRGVRAGLTESSGPLRAVRYGQPRLAAVRPGQCAEWIGADRDNLRHWQLEA
eukprot:747419-Hanusia_phi.AAC.1